MAANRDLAWEGCVNVRDLGGLGRVKPGALVRMEAPTTLTARGWASMSDYGVRTILDLRADDGAKPEHATRPAGIATVCVPLDPEPGTAFHDHWAPIENLATPLYFPALPAEYPDRVTAAVRAIAEAEPGCVVFHCAGGKDRTGLLALVLLALAGAEPDEIIADYLLTFERMRETYAALGARDQLVAAGQSAARQGTTVEGSLRSTIEGLKMPDYLLDNGISRAGLAALEDRLSRKA